MITIYHLSVAFSVLAALLCLRVVLHDRRRIQNVVFFAIGLAVAIFTGPIYLSFLYPEQPDITTDLNRISVTFTAVVTGQLFYFSLVFPTVRVRRKILARPGSGQLRGRISAACLSFGRRRQRPRATPCFRPRL